MSFLGIIYIMFFNVFLKLLTGDFTSIAGVPDFGFDLFIDGVEVCNAIYNIFAWVNIFVDVDLCLNLFLLTSMYYALKMGLRLAKFAISLFKK